MFAKRYLARQAAVIILSAMGSAAFAATGTVAHLSGSLSVQRADGTSSILVRNSPVTPGDVLTTEQESYAQINFSDGSSITLRPNTSVKVEAYNFNRDQPQADNSFLRLVKGGMRTVTGLIGRRGNQDAYKIGTNQATIGIRGSSGDTLDCSEGCPGVTPTSGKLPQGVYHATHTGAYIVQNDGGSVLVNPGQIAYVKDASTAPTILGKDPGMGLSQLPFSLGVPPGGPGECIVR
ncbi:MAG: FecR family protein [Betaproteobacteria bacterium]